MHVLVAPN